MIAVEEVHQNRRGRSGAKKVVPMGIEPMTSRLLVWRSTD